MRVFVCVHCLYVCVCVCASSLHETIAGGSSSRRHLSADASFQQNWRPHKQTADACCLASKQESLCTEDKRQASSSSSRFGRQVNKTFGRVLDATSCQVNMSSRRRCCLLKLLLLLPLVCPEHHAILTLLQLTSSRRVVCVVQLAAASFALLCAAVDR